MESDERIGICGAVIYSSFDHDLIVEAGAAIDLASGTVVPHFCNQRRQPLPAVSEVDYLGSGVSLLRSEMVEQIGVYDERYHFLWEDMDYGLHAADNGWRVVVCGGSEVYHPPFTEKRNPHIYAYYGVRNALLIAGRHTHGMRLLHCMHGNLKKSARIALLKLFYGRGRYASLSLCGVRDFITGRFGRFAAPLPAAETGTVGKEAVVVGSELAGKRLVVVASAASEVVFALLEHLRTLSPASVVLVVQSYRANLFAGSGADAVVTYNDRAGDLILDYLRAACKLAITRGMLINSDADFASPFTFLFHQALNWDRKDGRLSVSKQNLFSLWKPVLAVLGAEIFALALLPLVCLAAIRNRVSP
jgi:hypothetical protein